MNSIEDVRDPGVIDDGDTRSPGVERTLHPLRGAILRALVSAGSPLPFKGIPALTGMPPPLCAYHLKILGKRGLVKRTFDHGEGRKEFSYYSITPAGAEAVRIEDMLLHRSDKMEERVPAAVCIISWTNMPRCFIVGGG